MFKIKMHQRKAVIVILVITLLIYQSIGYTGSPEFDWGEYPVGSVTENQPIGTEVMRVTAINPDNASLTFILSGGAADYSGNGGHGAFTVDGDGNTAVIKTKVVLDYEAQNFYTLMLWVEDEEGFGDFICVDINVTNDPSDDATNRPNRSPVFNEGESTTRSISVDALPGTVIGAPIIATDPDDDPVSYALGIENPLENYGIILSMNFDTGELLVGTDLGSRTKDSYSVRIFANDGKGGKDHIDVTVNFVSTGQ